MSEEDVIPLIVEGDNSATGELWIVREETGKHSGDAGKMSMRTKF